LARFAEMRHLAAVKVEATFTGAPPDVSLVQGVSAARLDGQHLRCQVNGSIQPLLTVLAQAGVRELLSSEPSLEELFLSHYGAHA
jgi:ABC-2 type transport system ATP-binding protein